MFGRQVQLCRRQGGQVRVWQEGSPSVFRAVRMYTSDESSQEAVEARYQKKSQLEHILLRPDMYIGSVQGRRERLWVVDRTRNRPETPAVVEREVEYVPGLYKVFDEVLVNACDHRQRDGSMKTLRVGVDATSGWLEVFNDGGGIPVVFHREAGMFVPEMVFGELLTGSNYDDSLSKLTGGRNGYGAKLTNIYSQQFEVETADGRGSKQVFRQVFRNNMQERSEAEIGKIGARENYTRVRFLPDWAKFGLSGLTDDTVDLLHKRVLDVAATLADQRVEVFFNEERVGVDSFQAYMGLYTDEAVHARVNDRWQVGVGVSAEAGSFQQMSFVNSIWTMKGGTHVNMVADQVAKALLAHVKRKHKEEATSLTVAQVRNQLSVFVNCLVENPSFDSQTKETLTTRPSEFGSTCEIPASLVRKLVSETDVVKRLLSWSKFKQENTLKRMDGRKKVRLSGIPKLTDANWAGGRRSGECTLILTEGDSAKSLAISGLSVVGRDAYGVFPLRGKLLNVRDASAAAIAKNAEISAIVKILGIKAGETYTDASGLRYGSVMIMADQDHDGSHIKGLVINLFHRLCPSLLRVPGFLKEFATPIVKARRAKGEEEWFFSMQAYREWLEHGAGKERGWKVKYYKGLGTSTAEEAREYFGQLGRHVSRFRYEGKRDDGRIEMAFSKEATEKRKRWMSERVGMAEEEEWRHRGERTFGEFVDGELVQFSLADTARSIPSVVDGLKTGQRKILFSCFKRRLTEEMKVAQLAGYVAEQSAYHHGEAALAGTIVGMAQNYAGSNNVNLLRPIGQFGTRLQGGKDAASARYIYTALSESARALFPVADDAVLAYQEEEGQQIEPEWYVGVAPLVLMNGSTGIGTGWSSNVPCHHPEEVAEAVAAVVEGRSMKRLKPWYRGHTGELEYEGSTRTWTSRGRVRRVKERAVVIEELPVGRWTESYKEFLEKEMAKGENGVVRQFDEHHSEDDVRFEVTLRNAVEEGQEEALMGALKLESKVHTRNMHLFDAAGRIKRYGSARQMVEEFCEVRLEMYEKRRAHELSVAQEKLVEVENRARFVDEIVSGRLVLSGMDGESAEWELEHRGFGRREGGYGYLLGMSLMSLTRDRVDRLRGQVVSCGEEVARLEASSLVGEWLGELDGFVEVWKREQGGR